VEGGWLVEGISRRCALRSKIGKRVLERFEAEIHSQIALNRLNAINERIWGLLSITVKAVKNNMYDEGGEVTDNRGLENGL